MEEGHKEDIKRKKQMRQRQRITARDTENDEPVLAVIDISSSDGEFEGSYSPYDQTAHQSVIKNRFYKSDVVEKKKMQQPPVVIKMQMKKLLRKLSIDNK